MAKDWKKVRRNEQTLVKNLTKKKGKKIFDTELKKSYCRGYLAAITAVKKDISFFLENREEKELTDNYVQQQMEVAFISAANYLKNLEEDNPLKNLGKNKGDKDEKITSDSNTIVDSSGM